MGRIVPDRAVHCDHCRTRVRGAGQASDSGVRQLLRLPDAPPTAVSVDLASWPWPAPTCGHSSARLAWTGVRMAPTPPTRSTPPPTASPGQRRAAACRLDVQDRRWPRRQPLADPVQSDRGGRRAVCLLRPAEGLRARCATGGQKWVFDPFAAADGDGPSSLGVNRGVSYWADEADKRIFMGAGPYLYALNADTGTPDRQLR